MLVYHHRKINKEKIQQTYNFDKPFAHFRQKLQLNTIQHLSFPTSCDI